MIRDGEQLLIVAMMGESFERVCEHEGGRVGTATKMAGLESG